MLSREEIIEREVGALGDHVHYFTSDGVTYFVGNDGNEVPVQRGYLLIEQSRITDEMYYTTHHTVDDAADYHTGQECAEDWAIVKLVSLSDGTTLAPHIETTVTITWQELP